MYKAVLFAPDGDWVTYWNGCETVEEVQEKLANQGSTWFFYPFHAVITDNGRGFTNGKTQRIVDAAYPFEELKGRTIRTMSKVISNTDPLTIEAILS